MKLLTLIMALSIGVYGGGIVGGNCNYQRTSYHNLGVKPDRPHRDHLILKMLRGNKTARQNLYQAVSTIDEIAEKPFLLITDTATADFYVLMRKNIQGGKRDTIGLTRIDMDIWEGDVQILTGMTSDMQLEVITHELIHTLGINHNSNPNSIMFWTTAGQKQIITLDDMKDIQSAVEDFTSLQ
jgi:hypothetical protein